MLVLVFFLWILVELTLTTVGFLFTEGSARGVGGVLGFGTGLLRFRKRFCSGVGFRRADGATAGVLLLG